MPRYCIGIDLGGTFIKFALVDERMTIAAEHSVSTPASAGADGVIAAMADGALEMLARAKVDRKLVAAAGIGSPGPLDLVNGIVIGMPNIPGFANVPLRDRVGERLGLPAVLENDANAAGLGEFLGGSGQGLHDMVLLTLGTGLGSGIIVNGKVLHGAHGIGGEIGHMIVEPGGEECGCGQRGCMERYCSASHLARYARRLIEQEGRASSLSAVLKAKGDIDAADVNAARKAGDKLAAEVWGRACFHLAVGCVSICRVLDPDAIVLGGGMAKAGDDLLVPVTEHFRMQHWKLTSPRTVIRLASLGNRAGVLGAAGVAWEKVRNA
jgi:glucokinase